jgi:hypothetical protein
MKSASQMLNIAPHVQTDVSCRRFAAEAALRRLPRYLETYAAVRRRRSGCLTMDHKSDLEVLYMARPGLSLPKPFGGFEISTQRC